MSDERPVGVFDSGVGGLTVVGALERLLPREEIVYFGDTARVPYGTKSRETVTRFSVENIEFLMRHDVKLVVVACNTASSLALGFLKKCFRVPVMGVIEPGAKRAAEVTRTNRVGVIGTNATVASAAYEKAIRRFDRGISVYSRSCPLFVPLVEEGWTGNKVSRDIAYEYLGPIKAKKVDTLILGCTHYPLLKDVIGSVMGPGVALVDSAREVAKEAGLILDAGGMLNRSSGRKRHRFYVSDEPKRFAKIGERFLRHRIECVKRAG